MNGQAEMQLFGTIVACLVAMWVRIDASKRGFKTGAAFGWSVGVFLLMIVFLPLYLWARHKSVSSPDAAQKSVAPIAAPPCPYCEYPNQGDPNFCAKCGRQLKSSTEIHR